MLLDGTEKIFFTDKFGGTMRDKNEIFYSMNIEDIQTVATEEIERELTDDEIDKLIKSNSIADRIPWHSAIAAAINELISESKN